jgi:type II secretory pathway component PulF
MAAMLGAGLPVQKCLQMAAASARGSLRRGLRELVEAALRGESLAGAMSAHPEAFSPLEVLVMEAAETSGHMPESLEKLSKYYAFRDRLRRTVTSGLVLPLVILHIAALVIPFPGLILGQYGMGTYLLQMMSVLALFYVPVGAVVGIVKFTPDTGPLRRCLDGFTLWVPILGKAVRQLALSRFARTFQMLYSTGTVPIVVCVRKSAEISGNMTVKRWLMGGARSAEAGQPVSDGFSPELPIEFAASWRIAEEAGKLDETARRLADQAAENSERLFETLAVWTPRVIYFLVSAYIVVCIFRMFFATGGYYDTLNGLLKAE